MAHNLNNSWLLYFRFSIWYTFAQIIDSLKIQKVSNVYFEERAAK